MYLLDISVEKLYTELNIVWVGILAEDLPYENYCELLRRKLFIDMTRLLRTLPAQLCVGTEPEKSIMQYNFYENKWE